MVVQEGELGAHTDGPAVGRAVAVEGHVASLVEGVGVGEGLRVGAIGGDVGGVDWVSFRRGQSFFLSKERGVSVPMVRISSVSGIGVK